MKDKVTVKKKVMNNKSRKGNYIYVKVEGQRGGYYKEKKGLEDQDYVNAYLYGVGVKSRGVQQVTTSGPTIRTLPQGRRRIDRIIQSGTTTHYQTNALSLNTAQKKKIYSAVLSPLVKDSQLLGILTQPNNIEKIKNRLEYTAILKDRNNRSLAEINKIGTTFEDFTQALTNSGVRNGIELQDASPTIANKVKDKGLNYSHLNNGVVSQIDVKVTFRKG